MVKHLSHKVIVRERRLRTCHIKYKFSMYNTLPSVSKMAVCLLTAQLWHQSVLWWIFINPYTALTKKPPQKNQNPAPLEKKLFQVSLCHNSFYSLLRQKVTSRQCWDISLCIFFLTENIFLQQLYSGWDYVRFSLLQKNLGWNTKR